MAALSLADVRWRSRRDPAGGPPLVHVSFLNGTDRRTAAIVAGVCDYVASLAGRARRDYDPDVAVAIAGERRLGHGLAAACLDAYRWTARSFAEALPAHIAEGLAGAGVDTPSALRLRLFDLVNEAYGGFVPSGRRDEALARLAAALGLPPDAAPWLDPATALDAEPESVLVPDGPPPAVADVIGRYNRAALAALLRQAERIVFTVREPDGSLVRRLYASCRRLGVYCEVEQAGLGFDGFRLTLSGPDAVVGAPAAAGPRLALLALRLLRRLGPEDTAVAHLILRDRPYRLVLDRALLQVPGLVVEDGDAQVAESDAEQQYSATTPTPNSQLPSPSYDSHVEAQLARAFAALRRQGRAAGWQLVREPAPLLAGGRVLIPDFALVRGDLRVFVEVVGFWTPGYIEKKRRALERLPSEVSLVLAVAEPNIASLAGVAFPVVPYRDAVPVQRLLDVAEARYGDFAARTSGGAGRLAAACRQAAPSGWLSPAALAAALSCHTPGEVTRALATAPPPDGWEHVPGAGLVSAALRTALCAALERHWVAAGPGAALTLAGTRALLPDEALPDTDEALALVLARLPACSLAHGSLFDVEIRPAGASTGATVATPAPAGRPPTRAGAARAPKRPAHPSLF